jgi:hypothetical protein
MSDRKYYYHDEEIEIKVHSLVPAGMIRYCESPTYQMVPGCQKCFYSCEYEETYGVQKHVPGLSKFSRPKPGTLISCRDMEINYCQNLIDKTKLECPFCNRKLEVK